MRARTVRDLGSMVRERRRSRGTTQSDLAAAVGASRDWVVRLEKGHPRLEAQKVLDALAAVGLTLDAEADEDPVPVDSTSASDALDESPFADLFEDG